MLNLNLFRRSCALLTSRLPVHFHFSQYFREKDQQEIWDYNDRKIVNKKFRSLVNLWKKPLEKKKLRQARIQEIKANLPEPQPQAEKLIVHNPAVGIKTPERDSMFAVFKVDNRQFKVTNDCLIVLDKKQEHNINDKITFEEVLMFGTETYTLLGRPVVKSVTVEGVIESIALSEKVIVFKKKRRKQYKKSFGSRIPLTTCRITNIVHTLTKDILERAVPLS